MTGEANNINKIKLLYGTYHSPNRIENDANNINIRKQASTKNIISFLYKRGSSRILFSKMIFKFFF